MQQRQRQLLAIIALIGADGLFFGSTDPQSVPAWLTIVGFGLMIATVYLVARLLLVIGSWYGLQVRQRRLAMVVAMVLGGVLALQSIGELSVRDVAVLLPLGLLGYTYLAISGRSARSGS
ncbi:MAG TPA: hypothetical protein VG992_00500 [Candidatus Saccharimonadales bacterium]|nr:hypothetical protein [Candidatus Saccharimonadales bacterium]